MRTSRRPRIALALSVVVAGALLGCGTHPSAPLAPSARATDPRALLRAIHVQEEASSDLLGLDGVVGTGASVDDAGSPEIDVLTASAGVGGVPATIEGVRVVRIVVGPIRPWSLTG